MPTPYGDVVTLFGFTLTIQRILIIASAVIIMILFTSS
ncbi:High-affinity branched-chain amino acid transport system permease protein LivH [Geobacillus stearothermophilus]|uniref:High-affinity branched-chain amino acid transport system permease protein LivH n=1 Tax=Geobacillus stearothermophilus TaxID=1422 RepID=A0A150MUA1_GEOSE|nr:High-affinity branched-chain amino acid transport system permease protein LivH [Geobacillus stearothermophilus]KYD27979.1 hypothetical protein B4109_1446 [Geobacillus stearothermophilus]OAO81880.1 High-affinity branched-chain amino acid transport system permease protein LivH [Geobacillus stearothermophilus]